MLREGNVSHNLVDLLRPILDQKLDTFNTCIVTDDLDTIDGVELGHLDNSIRIALGEGLDFVKAIQMVSVNTARAFHVGHDNHNIIVMGTNYEDMALAVNEVARMEGGQIVVDGGEVIAALPLPVCGLVSDLPIEQLYKKKQELNAAIAERGGTNPLPFMVLSFICLAAIPQYAVTDHGFIDILADEIINPVLE